MHTFLYSGSSICSTSLLSSFRIDFAATPVVADLKSWIAAHECKHGECAGERVYAERDAQLLMRRWMTGSSAEEKSHVHLRNPHRVRFPLARPSGCGFRWFANMMDDAAKWYARGKAQRKGEGALDSSR
jgi:hypothetical protein